MHTTFLSAMFPKTNFPAWPFTVGWGKSGSSVYGISLITFCGSKKFVNPDPRITAISGCVFVFSKKTCEEEWIINFLDRRNQEVNLLGLMF